MTSAQDPSEGTEQLAGRVAVITGAARGIGYQIALRFGREGMRVVIADLDAPRLAEAERELHAQGVQAVAIPVDVSDFADIDRLPRIALSAFGAIDVVCLNAGVNATHVPTWEIGLEDWDWILKPNVWGVLNGIRAFVPRMLALERDGATGGHIVITSSNGALRMRASSGPYPTTKRFVLSAAESLYHDLKQAGSELRVSALLPGGIRTSEAMARRGEPRVARTEEQQDAEHRNLLPEEVAEIVLGAILEPRFYVLTHPERSHSLVRSRLESILEDRDPTPAVVF